jgi:hypothetical protein
MLVLMKLLWFVVLLTWYGIVMLAIVQIILQGKWRFSLRSLLITTTIVAILLGLLGIVIQSTDWAHF